MCLPGTRLGVLKKIQSWADNSLFFSNPPMMWVYGHMGCGKSAIAQEVAMEFARQNRLAACFFFFRGAGDRSTVARFATTLASQIAVAIPETAPVIFAAIRSNPALLSVETTSLSHQVEHLILRPINTIKRDKLAASLRPFLAVLDGIDECEDRNEVVALLEHIMRFLKNKPRTPLRFLITGRSDNHIHQRLHPSKLVFQLNLVKDTLEEDIKSVLDSAIAEHKQKQGLAFDESWPSLEERSRLIEHVGGSFIFLTTILKLLFSPETNDGLSPIQRLPLILDMGPRFDELYDNILAPLKRLPYVFDITSVIALAKEPLSAVQIAYLLNIEKASVDNVLVNLHAILQIPSDDERAPITIRHTSLRDFLRTENRARAFLASHKCLAYGCLSVIAQSRQATEPSPAVRYSRRYAKDHWVEFLNSLDSSTLAFTQEFEEIVKCVQKAFSPAVTDFHLCVFPKILHHLEGVHSLTARGGDAGSRATKPGSTSKFVFNPDVKWTALQMLIYPEKWQAFIGCRRVLQPTDLANGPFGWIHVPLPDISSPGNREQLCLYTACCTDRVDVVHLLLSRGTNPNPRALDKLGRSPLRVACDNGNVQCMVALLDHGANTDEGCVARLCSIAVTIHDRFRKNEMISELNEVVCLHRRILKLPSLGREQRLKLLKNLAHGLEARFRHEGLRKDLDEVILTIRELLHLCPTEHKQYANHLQSLSNALGKRFDISGEVSDLDEGISLRHQLLKLRPAGHKDYIKSLNVLAHSHHERFERQGSVDDLDTEIFLRRRLQNLQAPGEAHRIPSLKALATAHCLRFEKAESVADLDEEIPLRRELLKLQPFGHANHISCLRALSSALCNRFRKQGSIVDLHEEIPLRRELVKLHPVGHTNHIPSIQVLATALHDRFGKEGWAADLDDEIVLYRQLLELETAESHERRRYLGSLARLLATRFQKQKSITDLVGAIQLHREALKMCALGHADRAITFNCLSWSLVLMYEAQGDAQVLEEAVSLSRQSLALCPVQDSDRIRVLVTLASALQFYPGHLDEALQWSRESLSIRVAKPPPRWRSLMVLATILHRRYERSHSVQELEEAVSICRVAISLCPPHAVEIPKLLALQARLAECQLLSPTAR